MHEAALRAIERATARPNSDPATIGVARLVDPVERLEDLLALAARDARSAILDGEDTAPGVAAPGRRKLPRFESPRPLQIFLSESNRRSLYGGRELLTSHRLKGK
jgi:hypothetical protein